MEMQIVWHRRSISLSSVPIRIQYDGLGKSVSQQEENEIKASSESRSELRSTFGMHE